jgi:ABC-type nitrate/sulfonate/bicarbonate transport system permease component
MSATAGAGTREDAGMGRHAPARTASKTRERLVRLGFLVGLPVLLILYWWVATLGAVNFFVPKPGKLVETFGKVWFSERFFTDFLPSVARLFIGLFATIALGTVAGVLIGSFRWLRSLTEPILEFLRAVPPPVLVPLLMLLMGPTNEMRIVVIISGAIWPVLLNTVEGVRAVDDVLSNTCKTYRITGFARLRYLVLPAASPHIMTGIRQCLSIGLILMVISEMFGGSSGLGFTIVLFQRGFAIPEMWSGIVVLGLIGIALSLVSQAIERRVLGWYRGLKELHRDN